MKSNYVGKRVWSKMNYETDAEIQRRLLNHYDEALEIYNPDKIVGIFLQGSQNYGLGTNKSDVDTKCIVLPTFEEVCLNKKLVSYTHVRENDEHIDFKDLRLMLECFRKQNINFIEILFASYYRINPDFAEEWQVLIDNREEIAHYDEWQFVKSTIGQMHEKYKAAFLPRPSQYEEVEKYGWSTKNLHHLLRFDEFLQRFINKEPYVDCLTSKNTEFLLDIKTIGHDMLTLEEAKKLGEEVLEKADTFKEEYINTHVETMNSDIDSMLDKVAINIFRKSFQMELSNGT